MSLIRKKLRNSFARVTRLIDRIAILDLNFLINKILATKKIQLTKLLTILIVIITIIIKMKELKSIILLACLSNFYLKSQFCENLR